MPRKKSLSSGSSVRKVRKAPARSKRSLMVDFPQEGEIVTSPKYTFRIGAVAGDRVEISIDGKEWFPARESVGFWWFDWAGYQSGPHSVVARVWVGKRARKSLKRQFTVLI